MPEEAQRHLLSKLLHRDLANPSHLTNVHLHHLLPYYATHSDMSCPKGDSTPIDCRSFFNISPKAPEHFVPVDEKHKPFGISQFFNRKLRWMTLGFQYDWTEKRYPHSQGPVFPVDTANFVQTLFPGMKAEAAIVNVYSPGDALSVHRDVSEDSDNGLVSISLGCDAVFVIGLRSADDANLHHLAIRLHSGDAIYMSGEARYAWHGVPRIIPDSCPASLRSWPATCNNEKSSTEAQDCFEAWRDWMSTKRVNLNVRQMFD